MATSIPRQGSAARPGEGPDRRLSVAPMMDCTDRFDRFFLRRITRRALLYTEMVTTGRLCTATATGARFRSADTLSLCSSAGPSRRRSPNARASGRSAADEINLNVGCPSDRVQSGRFGVCLMRSRAWSRIAYGRCGAP